MQNEGDGLDAWGVFLLGRIGKISRPSERDTFLAGFKAGRANQHSQTRAADRWISVLDRLPNVEDKLLVLDDAAYVHMAYHRPDSETYRFDCDTYGLKISDVTHWMYVPEPPNAAAVPVEDRPAPTEK